jgi:hypothetical protein
VAFWRRGWNACHYYCFVPENVPVTPWQTGVLELHEPVPVIVPLVTVPLPVNSTKPEVLAATKTRFNVAPTGTGSEGTPIRTPWPLLLKELGSPVPEILPCALLLLAIKQTGPCTENVPTGVVTLQGLETNCTWYVPGPQTPLLHWEPTLPVEVAVAVAFHNPAMEVPDAADPPPAFLAELQPTTKTINTKIKMGFILLSLSIVFPLINLSGAAAKTVASNARHNSANVRAKQVTFMDQLLRLESGFEPRGQQTPHCRSLYEKRTATRHRDVTGRDLICRSMHRRMVFSGSK